MWREILKPVNPLAPRNDYERARFWEGWGVGLSAATVGANMKYFSEHWMMMVPRAHISAKILGPDGAITTREIFSIPPHAVPDEATRATWAERGTMLKRGGVALAGASGFADQWMRDSANPNLATDEKIGRATAEGVSMAGAALAGAEIGAMAGSVIPGAGTVGGSVIGAAIGIGAGVVTSTVVDKIDQPFVDFGGKVGDKVGDLADGAVDTGKKVVDKIGGVFGL